MISKTNKEVLEIFQKIENKLEDIYEECNNIEGIIEDKNGVFVNTSFDLVSDIRDYTDALSEKLIRIRM